jgi:hypothetical protein
MELLDLIGLDTKLKKSGSFYTGKCPIHSEDHPSFICSEKGFKCMSCGSSGKSPVTYIMLSRRMNKEQAIDYLKKQEETPVIKQFVKKDKRIDDIKYLMPADRWDKPDFKHYRHGTPSKVWSFKDWEGRLIGYTCRFETEDGKVVLPYNYISVNDCIPEWQWKAFKRPSVLYNCHLLNQHPDWDVVVVEGEKTADAITENMKNVVAVTWVGGSNALSTVDFSVLYGRNLILWPDNDLDSKDSAGIVKPYLEQPGNKAMVEIGNLLIMKCPQIMWVKNPITFKHKFDAADREWRKGEMKYFIQQNQVSFFDVEKSLLNRI